MEERILLFQVEMKMEMEMEMGGYATAHTVHIDTSRVGVAPFIGLSTAVTDGEDKVLAGAPLPNALHQEHLIYRSRNRHNRYSCRILIDLQTMQKSTALKSVCNRNYMGGVFVLQVGFASLCC